MSQLLQIVIRRVPPATLRRIGAWKFSSPAAARVIEWGSGFVRNQDVTIRHGQGAGLRFNAGQANVGYALGTTEPLVQDVFACCLRPGDVLFDIGANVGFFTVIGARLVGPTGKVFAFEPLPENVRSARHNAEINGFAQVAVMEAAVSDHAGAADLLMSAEPTWANLDHTGARPTMTGSIRVALVTIDDLVGQGQIPPPSLIKIDIEGAEVEALRGMSKTVAGHGPVILCENHGRSSEVQDILDEFGYWQIVIEEPLKTLRDANWNVHVLAGPPARKDVLDRLAALNAT